MSFNKAKGFCLIWGFRYSNRPAVPCIMGPWHKVSASTLVKKVGSLVHATVLWATLQECLVGLSVSFLVRQASC